MQLIESVAGKEALGALRIELLPPKNWVAEAERLRGPVRAGRFLVRGAHDLIKRTRPRRVVDIGTGTGILAIAAVKALNARVTASDKDPLPLPSLSKMRV
jgi:ribosomal protein L11 methyltransferase